MSKVRDLIGRMRAEFLADVVGADTGNSRWSNQELLSALNEVEKTLAKRLLLITDATTAAVCQIAVAATEGVYPRSLALSPLILQIDRLKYSGVTRPLPRTTRFELDRLDSGWDEKSGVPTAYVEDRGSITLDRLPESAATISLTVKRLPLLPLTLDGETELEGLDDELIHGALVTAYSKDDKQTLDLSRAKRWKDEFESDIAHLVREVKSTTTSPPIMRPQRW